jgi:hypothetical protein
MSRFREPAEPFSVVNDLRRNFLRNLDGTERNRKVEGALNSADWFRSVPIEVRCSVPLYLNDKKEEFLWFRYPALRDLPAGAQ